MRAIPLAALLWFVTAPAAAQTAGDSGVTPNPDRYVIDAPKLVREGGVYSVADLLISQVPGLFVVPGSGLTGVGARIRFAGPRALESDGAPLILVEGIRVVAAEDAVLVYAGPGPSRLDDLSPEDIESIEVLRGPASGAIYGAGASAGVILIRTKGGTSGPARQGGCSLTEQAAGRCSAAPAVSGGEPFAFRGNSTATTARTPCRGSYPRTSISAGTCTRAARRVPSRVSRLAAASPAYPGTGVSRCSGRC